ncbi:hypothetical protein Rhopal_003626-T1 [Rhodotorula paludigena]|uniref:DUF2423 domain-containing protein n=1 Tax=Rhodotorula paludigena TaxID=86838 RepID=A0AAV5GL47_9BASI|nr:hypothetical protein Rhopal_003626-T1 [Rhodotorula paludigena]
MAKSLRSKHNRAFRAKKRDDDKSAYKIAQDLRMQRMSAQLKASSLKPRALTDKEEWERKQEGYETVSEDGEQTAAADGKADGGMEVDGTASTSGAQAGGDEPKAKVSTSGPRMSRRESYRSSKGFTVKQTPKTHFRAAGEKKRMGCKPQRRR